LIFSQEDFHVSPIVRQVKEKEKETIDISGRKCLEQYGKSSPDGSWEKTFLDLLLGRTDWYSQKCNLIWKLKDTKSSRSYFQLAVLTPRTGDTESSLLLTPSTVDIGMTEGRKEKRTAYKESIGRHYVAGCLTEQIQGLLPTPREAVSRGDCGRDRGKGNLEDIIAKLLPTPRASEPDRTSEGYGRGLGELMTGKQQIRLLIPTPSQRDYKGARKKETLEKAGRNETNSLPDHFAQTGKTSQLNPLFVAEMMGFPPDWTILPFQNGETKA
jgi:hypothetical protein